MIPMHVYVITLPELGWNCVVGVLKAENFNSKDEARQWYLESNGIDLDYLNDYTCELHKVQS